MRTCAIYHFFGSTLIALYFLPSFLMFCVYGLSWNHFWTCSKVVRPSVHQPHQNNNTPNSALRKFKAFAKKGGVAQQQHTTPHAQAPHHRLCKCHCCTSLPTSTYCHINDNDADDDDDDDCICSLWIGVGWMNVVAYDGGTVTAGGGGSTTGLNSFILLFCFRYSQGKWPD